MSEPLIQLKHLSKYFSVDTDLFGRTTSRLKAVDDLSLDIDVVLPCAVRAIDSPSHPVRFELDGYVDQQREAMVKEEAAPVGDRDLILASVERLERELAVLKCLERADVKPRRLTPKFGFE